MNSIIRFEDPSSIPLYINLIEKFTLKALKKKSITIKDLEKQIIFYLNDERYEEIEAINRAIKQYK